MGDYWETDVYRNILESTQILRNLDRDRSQILQNYLFIILSES